MQQAASISELVAAVRGKSEPTIMHARWVQALHDAGERIEAIAALHETARLPGGSLDACEHVAFIAFHMGAHEIARDFYARVAELSPGDATAWYNLASSERTLGRLEQSEAACERSLAIAPAMTQAALLRSEVRTQRVDANHVDELRKWLGATQDARAIVVFGYALGKELDDLGQHDEAFQAFATGAQARRSVLDYDVERDAWKLMRIRETFSAERLATVPPLLPARFGFIVGMPRSGTTLLERVLTGNPQVASNGETDNLLKSIVEGSRPDVTDVFERFAGAEPERVQRAYARRAADPVGRCLILEKLPFNSLYAGAVRLTLPQARIVHVARNPLDNCLAMYTTLFGSAYPFSYDLAELGRYFIAHHDLMGHWGRVMGDQITSVSYEQFVQRPEEQGSRVAAHMGIEWNRAMVAVEKNPLASSTASAAQIRRPIYKGAVGRWRNYAKHLAPLVRQLEVAGVALD